MRRNRIGFRRFRVIIDLTMATPSSARPSLFGSD